MPSLGYPFVFECTNVFECAGCGEQATVERSGDVDLNHDPDSTDAAAHGFGT